MSKANQGAAVKLAAATGVFNTYPVAGAVYGNLDTIDNGKTHSMSDNGIVLCRVKCESLLDDGNWDGEGCTNRKPTCKTCAKRDPRFAS